MLNRRLKDTESTEARWLRARIHLLLGNYKYSRKDFNMLNKITSSERENLTSIWRDLEDSEAAYDQGMTAHALGNWESSVVHLSKALTVAKESTSALLLRAESFLGLGDFGGVKHDCGLVLRSQPHNPKALALLSRAVYEILGKLDAALACLRLCMRIPDGFRECSDLFDRLTEIAELDSQAKMFRDAGDVSGEVAHLEKLLSLDRTSVYANEARVRLCHLYPIQKDAEYTILVCSQAIVAIDEKDKEEMGVYSLYGWRAWAFAKIQRFKDALRDIDTAIRIKSPPSHVFLDLKQMIEKAMKIISERDYYQILEIERSATKKEIKAAYRRLVMIWHPDKSDHPEAEERFMLIVEAWEVLRDENLRSKFDRGEDVSVKAREKREKGMKFTFDKKDIRKDGYIKAKTTDPQTGEEEFVYIKIRENESENDGPIATHPRKQLPKHCCIF